MRRAKPQAGRLHRPAGARSSIAAWQVHRPPRSQSFMKSTHNTLLAYLKGLAVLGAMAAGTAVLIALAAVDS